MHISKGPSAESLKALETAPNMYLVLSPELIILTASDAYLKATQTTRDAISGRHIFDAFPDNPDLPDGDDGVQNINASLQAVLRTKRPDYMRIQRYDVPDINNPGKFIPRYWDPSHTPVLDETGEISYIIQLANNVTDKITMESDLLKSQLEQVETMEQMKVLNEKLLVKNIELRDAHQSLHTLNSELEQRVAKRTRDLAESEEALKVSFAEQQTLNEELASFNEEHAAINEELLTANEELTQIQQRLQHTNLELETSSSRLQMAIESTRLGTWDFNPVTGELFWSKECRDIYGIPQDLGASFELFSKLIYPDDRNRVQENIAASIDPGKKSRYDLTYRIMRHDNGEIRWIKVQGNVYFEQEHASRFIGTVLDITDLKIAEEKSAKLAAIIASSDDAIISKTFESVITSWNAAAERIFGYTEAEMIGKTIYKLIPADRQQEEPLILARLKSGERVEHFETKRLTKGGELIDVSVTVSPIKDGEGKIIGLSKIARDITERKRDEIRKNDFIGMVSHELKTPLTSLTAILQVLNSKLKKSADTFVPGALEKANLQVKKMSNMINSFLNISRLESGKMLIIKQPFIVGDLVKEIIEETNMTGSTNIIALQTCDKVVLQADRDKIGSVISNLLSNALKYSPKGSKVQVDCRIIEDQVQVSVIDEGLGIRPEDLEHIFDRFYRVESNHTRHISGFGIGLYLSAEIIQQHHGRIWVESESGKGSVFNFSLPLSQNLSC